LVSKALNYEGKQVVQFFDELKQVSHNFEHSLKSKLKSLH